MWTVLNSKIFNSVIVILVLIEGLVIFAELLIDYDVIQGKYQAPPFFRSKLFSDVTQILC